jgi:UDP-galactopyranose mutase
MHDWLVVGAGFAGSVLAERIAEERGERVLVVDRREHVGGNAFDERDAAGVLMHRYGPHIFHTNSDQVLEHLSRFTEWRPYEHRVLASVDGRLVPIPINRTTINELYGLHLQTEAEAEAFLASKAEAVPEIRTSEDVVVSKVGRELYEKFFRGYTRKQWGLDPSQLDKSVTARIPVRHNTDDRYFTDRHQCMPLHGYTAMFRRMLDHPLIQVETGVDYRTLPLRTRPGRVIYTGPIDEYFQHAMGKLPYRSLRFEHVTLEQPNFQPVGTVNYPMTQDYTRITEYKHLTGQQHPCTSLTYEYPSAEGDPYYPVPHAESAAMFGKYAALADGEKDVWFVGRLANYRYYNMDQVVGQALASFRRIDEHYGRPQRRPQLRVVASRASA